MQFYRTWKWTLRQKCTILKISFSSFKLQVALLSWSPKFHWMNSLMSQILEIRSNFIIDCNHEFNWALKPWHVRVQTFLSNSSEALLPSVILTSVHFNWHDLGSKKHLTSNLCATLYAYTHAYPGTWLSILTSQDHQVFLQLYFSKRFFFVLQLHVNSHDGKISWESPTLLQNDGILPILGRQLSQQHLEAWQCSVLGWYFLSNINPNWWDITYHWINWCFFQNGSNLQTMDITFSIFSDNITVKQLGATAQGVIFHRNISGHVWNEEVG